MPSTPESEETRAATSIVVKITPELKDRLAKAAERRCIGQGLLARRAIENLLDQLDKLDGLEIPGA